MSPFAIIGLATTFALDDAQLEQCELLLTRRLHPDRWQQDDSRLYKKALLTQAAVNQAMESIREPIERGNTLLTLQVPELAEELRPQHRPDQEFLLEQLELQEEVRETLKPERRRALKQNVRAQLKRLHEQIADAFADLEQSEATGSQRIAVARALQFLGEARYWRNLQRALRGEAPR